MANIIDSIKSLYNKYVGGGQPEVNQSFATPQDLAQMSFASPEDLAQMSFATPEQLNPLMSYATPEQLQALDNNLLLQQANNQAYNNILPELNIDFSNITEATPNLSPLITPQQQTIQPFTPANLSQNVTENIPGLDYGNITEATPNLSPVIAPIETPVEQQAVTIPGLDFSNITEATPNFSPFVADPIVSQPNMSFDVPSLQSNQVTEKTVTEGKEKEEQGFIDQVGSFLVSAGDFVYGVQRDIGLSDELSSGDDDGSILKNLSDTPSNILLASGSPIIYAGKELFSSVIESAKDGVLSSKTGEHKAIFNDNVINKKGYDDYVKNVTDLNTKRTTGGLNLSPHEILTRDKYNRLVNDYGTEIKTNYLKSEEYENSQSDYVKLNKEKITAINAALSEDSLKRVKANPGNNITAQDLEIGGKIQEKGLNEIAIPVNNLYRMSKENEGETFGKDISSWHKQAEGVFDTYLKNSIDLITWTRDNGKDETKLREYLISKLGKEYDKSLGGESENLTGGTEREKIDQIALKGLNKKEYTTNQLTNLYLGGTLYSSPLERLNQLNQNAVSAATISRWTNGKFNLMDIIELPTAPFAFGFKVADDLIDASIGRATALTTSLIGGIAGKGSFSKDFKDMYTAYMQSAEIASPALAFTEKTSEARPTINGGYQYLLGWAKVQGNIVTAIIDIAIGSKSAVLGAQKVGNLFSFTSGTAQKIASFTSKGLNLGMSPKNVETITKGFVNGYYNFGQGVKLTARVLGEEVLIGASLNALDPEASSELSRKFAIRGALGGILMEGTMPIVKSIKNINGTNLAYDIAAIAAQKGGDLKISLETIEHLNNELESLSKSVLDLPIEARQNINSYLKDSIGNTMKTKALVAEAYKQGLVANSLIESFYKGDQAAADILGDVTSKLDLDDNMLNLFRDIKNTVDDPGKQFYDMLIPIEKSKGKNTLIAFPSSENGLGKSLLDISLDNSMYSISARTASYFPNKPIITETVFSKQEVNEIVKNSGGEIRMVENAEGELSHFTKVEGGYKINPLTSDEIGIKKKYISIDDVLLGQGERDIVDNMNLINESEMSKNKRTIFDTEMVINSGAIENLQRILSNVYC